MRYYLLNVLILLSLFSSKVAAQAYGPIECEWNSKDLRTCAVLVDDANDIPKIWMEYENAYRIRYIISGEWEIETPDGTLKPEYIVYLRNSEASFYDACELAYNYFIKHKNRRKFQYDGFVVTTRIERDAHSSNDRLSVL